MALMGSEDVVVECAAGDASRQPERCPFQFVDKAGFIYTEDFNK